MTAALNRNAAGAWSDEAKAIVIQASVLSGEKLDQLVRRLQRRSGRSRESCWRDRCGKIPRRHRSRTDSTRYVQSGRITAPLRRAGIRVSYCHYTSNL